MIYRSGCILTTLGVVLLAVWTIGVVIGMTEAFAQGPYDQGIGQRLWLAYQVFQPFVMYFAPILFLAGIILLSADHVAERIRPVRSGRVD